MGNQLTTAKPNPNPEKTVIALIERSRDQIQRALPRHVSADRLLRVAITTVRRNPELAACDQYSLIGAIMQSAQLGLEPDGVLGRAYLVPFRAKDKPLKQVQLIVGYRGLMDLARRSGEVVAIYAHVVRARDELQLEYGLVPKLVHTPFRGGDAGEIVGAYAVATFRAGGSQCEYLERWEIDEVRKQSKAGDYGPWATHYAEMAKKTAVRRLCKYLPASVEMQTALSLEDQHDQGIAQGLGDVFDVDSGVVPATDKLAALTSELEEKTPPKPDPVNNDADFEAAKARGKAKHVADKSAAAQAAQAAPELVKANEKLF